MRADGERESARLAQTQHSLERAQQDISEHVRRQRAEQSARAAEEEKRRKEVLLASILS